MIASKKGLKDIVKLLIKYGAIVNIRDNGGLTALKYAKNNGHNDIAELLKQANNKT